MAEGHDWLQPAAASRRRLLVGAAALLLAASAPCAVAARRRLAIEALLEWLPGRYSSGETLLDVVPVYAPLTAPHAFYLRECDPIDESRVVDQQLLAATPARRGRALLRVWRFVDAARWRDAHRATELFKGLMPGDVVAGAAVEIEWAAGEPRLASRPGAAFRFTLDGAVLELGNRFERSGSRVP